MFYIIQIRIFLFISVIIPLVAHREMSKCRRVNWKKIIFVAICQHHAKETNSFGKDEVQI